MNSRYTTFLYLRPIRLSPVMVKVFASLKQKGNRSNQIQNKTGNGNLVLGESFNVLSKFKPQDMKCVVLILKSVDNILNFGHSNESY